MGYAAICSHTDECILMYGGRINTRVTLTSMMREIYVLHAIVISLMFSRPIADLLRGWMLECCLREKDEVIEFIHSKAWDRKIIPFARQTAG
jgi:hypothetical protein